jgi:predicted CopG family antitoxin
MLNNRTITVTEEAYHALMKQKRGNETLSDTIMRLTKNGKPADDFTKRIMDNKRRNVQHELGEGWFNSSDLF